MCHIQWHIEGRSILFDNIRIKEKWWFNFAFKSSKPLANNLSSELIRWNEVIYNNI